VDLIALGIDDARASLIARFEAYFSFECFDLVFVEDATVLVAELDALFFREDGQLFSLRRRGDLRLF
jgi:hypothetical protein